MILKNGAEVREVYLGNVPVSEIYIGGRLVWGGRVYIEGAAIIILTSHALLSLSDGVTYTAEGAGLPLSEVHGSAYGTAVIKSADAVQPVVCAGPYMRYIAPMLASLPADGICKAVPGYNESDLYGTDEGSLGTGIHENDGISAPGGIMLLSPIASSIEEVNAVGGAGGVIRLSPVISAVQEIYMSLGEGAFDRDLYTADMLCIVPIVHGGSAISTLRHGYEAVYRVRVLEASGKPDGVRSVLYSVCGTHGIDADGAAGRETGMLNALAAVKPSKAPGRSFACVVQSPATAITEIKSRKAGVTHSSTEITFVTSLLRPFIKLGVSKTVKADDSMLPHENVTLTSSAGTARNTRHTTLGICSASMTTEIYTEPAQSDLDSTLITDIDGLNVTDMDVTEIKI